MALFKVKDNKLEEIKITSLDSEGQREGNLEEWIIKNPDVLGEDLLIIGKQVRVEDVADGIDLLAIDRDGNLVILELKRGRTPNDIDFQALKYASYVETWDEEDIESQFLSFMETPYGKQLYPDVDNFHGLLDDFCNEDYELNGNQRIIIIANEINEKIGSVFRWLDKKGIDVGLIEIKYYNDGNGIILHPNKILPIGEDKQFIVGKSKIKKEAWKLDGQDWHLNKRSNPTIRDKLVEGIALLKEVTGLEGPFYEQKFYISFKKSGVNQIGISTQANQYWIWIRVKKEDLEELNPDQVRTSLKTEVKASVGRGEKILIKIDKDYKFGNEIREFIKKFL